MSKASRPMPLWQVSWDCAPGLLPAAFMARNS